MRSIGFIGLRYYLPNPVSFLVTPKSKKLHQVWCNASHLLHPARTVDTQDPEACETDNSSATPDAENKDPTQAPDPASPDPETPELPSSGSGLLAAGHGLSLTQPFGMGLKLGGGIHVSPVDDTISVKDKSFDDFLDDFQGFLDVAGLTPGVGNFFDGLNAVISAARGNWTAAALSAAAMVPILGQAVTIGKAAKNASSVISKQKQAGHIPGTPQNANRIKHGKPTSSFFGEKSGERLTQETFDKGKSVPGRSNVREYDFGVSTGTGPNGGMQTRVRVHQDSKGRIHGHPSGPERF